MTTAKSPWQFLVSFLEQRKKEVNAEKKGTRKKTKKGNEETVKRGVVHKDEGGRCMGIGVLMQKRQLKRMKKRGGKREGRGQGTERIAVVERRRRERRENDPSNPPA
jgi:hypothetical protein